MSRRVHDVVVVGGGPSGLAVAAAAAARGLDVVLVEARSFPVDQACGEGLLPVGVRALEALGVRSRLGPGDATPIPALRWIDEGGPTVEVALPAPGGLGVRRTALSAVLLERALEAGVELLSSEVLDHRRGEGEVEVTTAKGAVLARLLVAADGRGSRIRLREGLQAPPSRRPRFGVRRHLAVAHWTAAVEVHLGDGAEAYVTPAGAGRIGVAFLFERAATGGWPALLARFPSLAARVEGAPAASQDRGAGPIVSGSTGRVKDRLVLLGDAAGSVDALSGEGASRSLAGALELAVLLPDAIAAGASRAALQGWERVWRRRHRVSVAWTALLLALARRPALRRRVIGLGGSWPRALERLVAVAVG